jgi:hypothetical protein
MSATDGHTKAGICLVRSGFELAIDKIGVFDLDLVPTSQAAEDLGNYGCGGLGGRVSGNCGGGSLGGSGE